MPSPLFSLHIHIEATIYLYTYTLCRCTHDLHHILALCPWLHALARVTTTPFSCLKPMPLLVVAMAPFHILSCLGATTCHDIAPMTPQLCTRHYALMHRILHHILSQLHYCCNLMAHPSNKPYIVPIVLQVASHKALHLCSFIKKGVCIMPNAISTIGYISLHVVELMHGCRKRLPYVPCSCQRPYTKAPWYGHALVIMSHLEAWYIVLFGCLTKYLLFNTYITIYVRDEAPWMLQWIHLNL